MPLEVCEKCGLAMEMARRGIFKFRCQRMTFGGGIVRAISFGGRVEVLEFSQRQAVPPSCPTKLGNGDHDVYIDAEKIARRTSVSSNESQ